MPERSTDPLTVAIPFYKGQAYLRRAIESVLRQTSPDWRLVVCDDGPEPGTADLVASFGDPRVRYLKNERNLGMAGNWNRCLDAADTDLVNLLHNDDELLPDYVGEMLRAGCAFPDAAAFFCRAKVIDADGRATFSLVDYVKRFLQPIFNFFRHRITNATAEGLNSKIQAVKRMANGFRNTEHFKTAIYFHCGGLAIYPAHGEV